MPETTARDYRSTLNLPKTDFAMRAELPKREPDRVRWWAEHDTYRKRLEHNRVQGGEPYVLLGAFLLRQGASQERASRPPAPLTEPKAAVA